MRVLSRTIRAGLLLAALVLLAPAAPAGAQAPSPAAGPTVPDILEHMAQVFSRKISDTLAAEVRLNLQPARATGEIDFERAPLASWTLSVRPGRVVRLVPDSAASPAPAPRLTFYVTEPGLRLLRDGRLGPSTAALQAHGTDPVFLDWRRARGIPYTPALQGEIQTLVHFFNPSYPERVTLGMESSRMVHGVPAVGLYYGPGMRSAWHRLERGARLNEFGQSKPYHQAFIFTEGAGVARIGGVTTTVRAGESIYVPPQHEAVVWTEGEGTVSLVWLAWGEGA